MLPALKYIKKLCVNLIPVSYTHLDVYKRQEFNGFYQPKRNDKAAAASHHGLEHNTLIGTHKAGFDALDCTSFRCFKFLSLIHI